MEVCGCKMDVIAFTYLISRVYIYISIRLLFSLLFIISMSQHDVLLFSVHCCVFSVSFS